MSHSNFVPALLVPLFIWRIYRRVRRNIGWQPLREARIIVYIIIFGLLVLGAAVVSRQNLTILGALGGGLAAGTAVGWVGLYFTRFEATPKGRFYLPNPYIGVGISLLLIGRIVYRITLVYSAGELGYGSPQLSLSPWTLGLFGVMAGYYLFYYSGLLILSRRQKNYSEATIPDSPLT